MPTCKLQLRGSDAVDERWSPGVGVFHHSLRFTACRTENHRSGIIMSGVRWDQPAALISERATWELWEIAEHPTPQGRRPAQPLLTTEQAITSQSLLSSLSSTWKWTHIPICVFKVCVRQLESVYFTIPPTPCFCLCSCPQCHSLPSVSVWLLTCSRAAPASSDGAVGTGHSRRRGFGEGHLPVTCLSVLGKPLSCLFCMYFFGI